MGSLLQAFTSWGHHFLVSYVVPAAGFVGVIALLIAPRASDLPFEERLREATDGAQLLSATVALLLLAILMNLLSSMVYDAYFGYFSPGRVKYWCTERQRRIRDRALERAAEETDVAASLVTEAVSRFPVHDELLYPTRLGNAIAAGQEFGDNRYGLDFYRVGLELKVVVPERLQRELEQRVASLDFFVNLSLLSLLMAGCSVAFSFDGLRLVDGELLAVGVLVSGFIAYIWYRLAVRSTDAWREAVQAMINVGRLGLAEALGLRVPSSIDEEREMWRAVMGFIEKPVDDSEEKPVEDSEEKPVEDSEEEPVEPVEETLSRFRLDVPSRAD